MNGTDFWLPRFATPSEEAKGCNICAYTINGQLNPIRLWAAGSRPYNCGGKAADGSTRSSTPTGCGAFIKSRPIRPVASLSGGTAAIKEQSNV